MSDNNSNQDLVKSPYNFVPLNEKVFFPPWASLVSHDYPFKEGLSGKIKLTLTAKTPIFIRGKQYDEESNGAKKYAFMQHNGKYCIPGSSLKGMIRSVLEIMSFGKLDRFNNFRLGYRDLRNPIYTDAYRNKKIYGGWLSKNHRTNEYIIRYYSLDTVTKIYHNKIDELYQTQFEKTYKDTIEKKEYQKTEWKYDQIKKRNKSIYLNFNEVENSFKIGSKKNHNGILVFTGQSGPRKRKGKEKWVGKVREFVFSRPNEVFTIKKDHFLIKNFFTAHKDQSPNDQSDEYKYRKKQLDNGEEIPIFIAFKKIGALSNPEDIEHFGISYMHQLPYKNTIANAIKQEVPIDTNALDFADVLFGYINDKNALKGRVSFKNAYTESKTNGDFHTKTLSSPKPTFYPFYLEQNGEELVTYDDDNAKIAGRKRYPVKELIQKNNEENKKINISFLPLPKKTKFTTEIAYHNLLPIELGALLSAITFHGNHKDHFHTLGMAKPYGYGAVSIEIEGYNDLKKHLKSFESIMNIHEPTWVQSPQIKELFAMARMTPQKKSNKLNYMLLKDFAKVKKQKKHLPRFTNFIK